MCSVIVALLNFEETQIPFGFNGWNLVCDGSGLLHWTFCTVVFATLVMFLSISQFHTDYRNRLMFLVMRNDSGKVIVYSTQQGKLNQYSHRTNMDAFNHITVYSNQRDLRLKKVAKLLFFVCCVSCSSLLNPFCRKPPLFRGDSIEFGTPS